MTYQVLARKWRPRHFNELVGQAHIAKALSHALTVQHLHHAYMFTGTRGVGKTTIARILAKSLNCESGVTATPCGACQNCQDIDVGSFPDLIEVDAASRTKVEDTRELLENVSYAPTRGRYKVYLIDEVHMLSGHSFNALLKTLEEPPSHVKFLLATTDPEKVPVTVLSRCLHFNLRLIPVEEITAKMVEILTSEKISYDEKGLYEIAQAAKGSMRDALSLLEQAIAIGEGKVSLDAVQLMLGLSSRMYLQPLLEALFTQNAEGVFQMIAKMVEQGVNFMQAIDAMLESLHAISLSQMVPEATQFIGSLNRVEQAIIELQNSISHEQVQLFYQILLKGKNDCPLAPSLQMGFEMLMLRCLCFQPFEQQAQAPGAPKPHVATKPKPPAKPAPVVAPSKSSQLTEKVAEKAQPVVEEKLATSDIAEKDSSWAALVKKLPLKGLARMLAQHCVVEKWALPNIELRLSESQQACLSDERQKTIADCLEAHLGQKVRLTIHTGEVENTPIKQAAQAKENQLNEAKAKVQQDERAQYIMETFGASLEKVSVDDSK